LVDVTVIIPTHNRRQLLARTLDSVLAQHDVDLDVVVVDDGGADDVGSLVACLDDARVRLVRHPESRGVSAARNSGISQATAPWVAFVDDDDLWAPTKLRSQLDALAARPSARWSCTGAVNIDAQCRISGWHAPPPDPSVGDLLLSQNWIPGGGSGVLASRDLTLAIGGFDEALSNIADWDFYIRLGLTAPMAPVFRPHLGYYVHTQGMAHGVERSAREYRYLDVKYAAERARRGIQLNEEVWLQYLAGLAYNAGRRRAGLRFHGEMLVRLHRWRSLLSIGVGLAPERVRRARARRYVPPAMPPDWVDEAQGWLSPYTSGWLDQTVEP